MANVIHRTTLQYLKSVNTPDYPESDWIRNPDMSLVAQVPQKYWKIDGEQVKPMTQVERDVVDGNELLERKSRADNFQVGLLELVTALIKVINVRLPSGQKITKQEMIDAVKEEIK